MHELKEVKNKDRTIFLRILKIKIQYLNNFKEDDLLSIICFYFFKYLTF